jgi:PhzF family phenazine biosynthesis protein
MKIPIYYIDAFADKLFSGNPAAVIFSDIDDSRLMQKIAQENNLSETAFIREESGAYFIRWFAPSCEIDLCGHATLASAFVYFNFINKSANEFIVNSKVNGQLRVDVSGDFLLLDFPKDTLRNNFMHEEILEVLGVPPIELYEGRDDILAILDNEVLVRGIKPDFSLLKNINKRGLIISAEGSDCDFVSRCFFPSTGVDEDPVTGSAHTTLTPYWSQKLEKKKLYAKQLSERGGVLYCEEKDSRVIIGGKAVKYMQGSLYL